VIVAFVDENRAQFGVEFICTLLQVAPSSYYAAKKRQAAPSARAVRDLVMMQVLLTLWIVNRKVYGAHKLWKAAGRAGHDIGRDQVARLMRELDIVGVSRLRKKVFTTRADPDATRAPDLVNRHFKADRPDALWVTDLTYVPTRSGMAYVLVTWNQRAGWIVTDRHHDHELRGPVAREHRGEMARPGSARASRRVAHDLDQSGPRATHYRRLCAGARGVPAGL